KKQQLKGGSVGAHESQLGAIDGAVTARLAQLEQQAVVRRISEKDAGLWKSNGTVEKEIRDRLGWLQVADRMEERVPELDGLRKELVGEGFTDVVLMGMGGSSLAPEVFRQTFGVPKGALDVHVLDTTDPALSHFGRVPAALGGVDPAPLLDRTAPMTHACSPSVPAAENPGAWLGAVFAEAAKVGRDKITIIAPPPIQSFGIWAEQLIAE